MILSAIIIIVCVLIDQISKHIAREKLAGLSHNAGFFTFSIVKNYGAFRGLLQKNKRILTIIQGISMLVIAVLLGMFIQRKDKVSSVGLALILGGAIGNFIDRVTEGGVTDFFAVKWTKDLYYNIADFFVFIGAGITLLRELIPK